MGSPAKTPESAGGIFLKYRRTQIAEMTPWTPGFNMSAVSVSVPDRVAGSPKAGDMIARNPKNHDDKWLVAAAYFKDNFEPLPMDALEIGAELRRQERDETDTQAAAGFPAKD